MVGRRKPRLAPRPLSSALAETLAEVAPQTPLASVQLAWPTAAGESIAAEARPVSERDGVVAIACSSASWAEQLDLLTDELLERLRSELGPRAEVRELRFRVADSPL